MLNNQQLTGIKYRFQLGQTVCPLNYPKAKLFLSQGEGNPPQTQMECA
jgi:hypothetical protein